MWVNLTIEEVRYIDQSLRNRTIYNPNAASVVNKLRTALDDGFAQDNQELVERASDQYEKDGEIEVDRQSDGSALISRGDDGAYVMAWVWVADKYTEYDWRDEVAEGETQLGLEEWRKKKLEEDKNAGSGN